LGRGGDRGGRARPGEVGRGAPALGPRRPLPPSRRARPARFDERRGGKHLVVRRLPPPPTAAPREATPRAGTITRFRLAGAPPANRGGGPRALIRRQGRPGRRSRRR